VIDWRGLSTNSLCRSDRTAVLVTLVMDQAFLYERLDCGAVVALLDSAEEAVDQLLLELAEGRLATGAGQERALLIRPP
jgi:hypothetical protein